MEVIPGARPPRYPRIVEPGDAKPKHGLSLSLENIGCHKCHEPATHYALIPVWKDICIEEGRFALIAFAYCSRCSPLDWEKVPAGPPRPLRWSDVRLPFSVVLFLLLTFIKAYRYVDHSWWWVPTIPVITFVIGAICRRLWGGDSSA